MIGLRERILHARDAPSAFAVRPDPLASLKIHPSMFEPQDTVIARHGRESGALREAPSASGA
jgi:hypothetical protein